MNNACSSYVLSRSGKASSSSFPSSHSSGGRGGVSASPRKERVLLFIVAGIVGFLVLCVVLVLCIVVSYRRKKHLHDETDSSAGVGDNAGSDSSGDGGDGDAGRMSMGVSTAAVQSPGFAVCDENDLVKDSRLGNGGGHYDNGGAGRFLLASSSIYSDVGQPSSMMPGGQNGTVSFSQDGSGNGNNSSSGNVYSNAYSGWTELNNPYVVQSPDGSGVIPAVNNNGISLPTYRNFQAEQQNNSYVPNYLSASQPTYARPLPKSQRSNNGSSIYSNTLQHSTPQSQSGGGGSGTGVLYRQNLASTLLGGSHQQNSVGSGSHSGSSGDERVPSISPPIDSAATGNGESVRLISSLSNTPTKSILKKPKNYNYSSQQQQQQQQQSVDLGVAPLVRHEDQSSQSSSSGASSSSAGSASAAAMAAAAAASYGQAAAAAAASESSNVSGSDRDSPTDKAATAAAVQGGGPDFSPSNTYLETSFEGAQQQQQQKVPPPTLPKPSLAQTGGGASAEEGSGGSNTLDKKVRNITQV